MPPRTVRDSIAIIGMACIFPGAHSPEALWEDILAGRRALRKVPPERLPRALYYDPDPKTPDKTYCDQIAVIADWTFDPLEFQIPPVTVEVTDPTHWLALSTARGAFADAGLDFAVLDCSRIGVVLGNTLGGEYGRSTYLRYRWPFVERAFRHALVHMDDANLEATEALLERVRHYYLSPIPQITEDSLAGTMANTIAGRICNYFDLGGGGYTVDGACSSSLLAIATACQAVASGDIDIALAGGVDVSLDPYELIGFAKTQALAIDDIRPYDERASGMLPGEGCGLVVLMREAEAQASGHRIRAVIRGWGYSSDGRGGITAPRREGQIRALRRAYECAGYPISTVGLIEGHGTGTVLGDQVELSAIIELLADSPDGTKCRIGSIKGNIGHCKAAAGAAGLIKVVMALERKILPPTSGCERPHPLFGRRRGPLIPALKGEVWERGSMPRRAAVSAFGFGGSNAHITIEEYDPEKAPSSEDLALLSSAQTTELVLVSAADRQALAGRVNHLRAMVPRITRAELTDLAAALARTDPAEGWRLAVVATSPWQLAETLDRLGPAIEGGQPLETLTDQSAGIFAGVVSSCSEALTLVALFPGQGAQRPGMGAHLVRRYPFVREMYEELDAAVVDLVPRGVKTWVSRDVREADAELAETWTSELRATEVAQPAIVAASLVTLRVLEFHGLRPDIVLGHSLGEISALCAARACEPVTAVRIAALRGRAMSALELTDPGAMAAIAAEPSVVKDLIAPFGSEMIISNYNSPRQTVVSGGSDAIAQLILICRRKRIPCQRLQVSHAFHSPWVAPAAKSLQQALRDVTLGSPSGMMISTATGDVVRRGVRLRRQLSGHVRQPVHFTTAVQRAQQMSPTMWMEVGPGGTLTGLVREILGTTAAPALTTDRADVDGFTQLNMILGQAFVLGFPIITERLIAHRFSRPFPLEDYAPHLLVNPCERPVAPPARASESARSAMETLTDEPDERTKTLSFVLDWIARRTGYPRISITPELRLRDDLNLDSIKAMELIQLMVTRREREIQPEPGWENLRIGDLVDAVLRANNPGSLGSEEQGFLLRASPLEGIENGGDWVCSFRVGPVDAPLAAEPTLSLLAPISVFVVAPRQCRRARAIAAALIDAGFAPVVLTPKTLLRRNERPIALGGLIWVLPEEKSPLECSPETFDARLSKHAATLFRLARWAVGGPIGRATRLRWLVLRPDAAPMTARAADAGAAFFKSLHLEYPRLSLKWIRVPSSWAPHRWGQMVVEEFHRGGVRVGYAYSIEGRRTTDAALPLETKGPPLVLGQDDVVLVTGGARGITSKLALALGKGSGARLALVGTSSATDPEIHRSCQRFEVEGVRAHYFPCDVTNWDTVRELLKTVERELGPVTAILHGAGVSRPAPFEEMSLDDYLRCIRVKALGLYNLLHARPPQHLKSVHVLSSVLGHTGMVRQADYTFANAWLDGAVSELQGAHPSLHALALGYSVWRDTGLGERLGVVEVLSAMGVTVIDSTTGVAAYTAPLHGAYTGPRLVITGRLVPELEAVLFPQPASDRSRFLERLLRYVPGVEIVAEATLTHDQDPYLRDHIFEGTPILPAVMGIEAMVAAAMACVQCEDLPTLQNVCLRLPVIVPEGVAVAVRIYALAEPSDDGRRRVQVALRAQTDGFAVDRFVATCVFGPPVETKLIEPLEHPIPPRLPLDPEAFAPDPLFQGPLFRRLTGIRRLEPGVTCLADVQLPDNAIYFKTDPIGESRTPYPAARDAFLQTILLLSGGRGLMTGIRELRFLRACPPGTCVVCRACLVADGGDRPTLDLDVFTLDGEPVEALHGVVVESTARHGRPNSVLPPELSAELAAS